MAYDRFVLRCDKRQVLITGSAESINNVGFLILPKGESIDSANRFLVSWPLLPDLNHWNVTTF